KTVGEISEPIKGPAAWHVVRLDERRPAGVKPFDEVRDGIMKTLRDRYIAQQRELRVQAIYRDPDLQINQPAIDALVNKVDPRLLKPGQPVKPGGSVTVAPATAAPSTSPAAAPPVPTQVPSPVPAPK
ncbi:MAG: peptidyl-prolyl cis-trans isomerase, partial [Casimicrobiaceae bacterium]